MRRRRANPSRQGEVSEKSLEMSRLQLFEQLEVPEGGTSWAAGAASGRKNEKNGSDIIGWEYNVASKPERKSGSCVSGVRLDLRGNRLV